MNLSTPKSNPVPRRLTKTEVDNIPFPDSGQVFYRDSDLQGFKLRVTPRCKTYVVEVRVKGKPCRFKIGRHGTCTPDEARSNARVWLNKMQSGVNPHDERKEERTKSVTLSEAFDEYKRVRTLKESTQYNYEKLLNRCCSDWLSKPLSEITKDMVLERHIVLSSGCKRGSGKAQANSVMRVFRAIHNFAGFRYEVDGARSLPENPTKRLSQLRVWNKIPRRTGCLKRSQLASWFKAVCDLDDDVERDYLIFVVFSGLRRTEAAQLSWDRVDFQEESFRVEDTKNGEELELPLSDILKAVLVRRFDSRGDSMSVFPGDGATGCRVEFRRGIDQVMDETDIRFTPHDLRRTFSTVADSLDISPYAIKRLLNHKFDNDVTGGYIVRDVERLRAPMQGIADLMIDSIGRESVNAVFPLIPKTSGAD